jgi:hypothetical protein
VGVGGTHFLVGLRLFSEENDIKGYFLSLFRLVSQENAQNRLNNQFRPILGAFSDLLRFWTIFAEFLPIFFDFFYSIRPQTKR